MSKLAQGIRAIPTTYLVLLILALFLPAHLINLGVAAFIGDEAIRSLVSLEMHLSGNYIATTMNGAPYLNKPPLFNWILLVFFKIFGYFGEFPARAATVFFLAVYGISIYRFTRKEFGNAFAFLVAMMTVTSGRFLIYDSMLGLIDTCFSAVIFSLFMSIYYFGSRGQWQRLFLVTYALMTVGFLLKGLPAIVFQGLSLVAGLWFFGQWRRLFSWQHVWGGMLALLVLGTYLAVYAQYRPLEVLLPNLLNESVKRTAVVFGWWDTVVHLFTFPFESVYHFLPFSLLVLAWLDRRFWQRLRQNQLAHFCFVMLAANLPIYWSSVQVYPRYLLMFIPLFTIIGFYLMQQDQVANNWRFKLFHGLLGGLSALLPVAFFAMPFVSEVNFLENIWPLSIAFGLLLSVSAVCYFADRKRYVFWMVTSLLIGRIAFDVIILPARHHENDISLARAEARAMADKYRDRTWYTFAHTYAREPADFYLTERLGYIIQKTFDPNKSNAIYLVNPMQEQHGEAKLGSPPIDTLHTDYSHVKMLLFARD